MLKRASQASTERFNRSPAIGLDSGHDGLDASVGRVRRTVPRIILSHKASGSLTIPCGSSRICDVDWMGQSPFAPQFAALVKFSSWAVQPTSLPACRWF